MSPRKQLAQKLHKLIDDGTIAKDGKLLPEREIAEMLNVSRPLLRQSLAIVEAFGIIEIRGRDGMFKKEHAIKDITSALNLLSEWPVDVLPQIFEMRAILEPVAAKLAARRRTADDLTKMRESLDKMENLQNVRLNQREELGSKWNKIFHLTIARATHNIVFVRILEGILSFHEETTIALGRHNFERSYAIWPPEVIDEHKAILTAVENQDEEGAESASVRHLKKASQRICYSEDYVDKVQD